MLKRLIDEKVLEPGENALSCLGVRADLLSNGNIKFRGKKCTSCTAFASHVRKAVFRKSPYVNGWTEVKHKGRYLSEHRDALAQRNDDIARLVRIGRKKRKRHAVSPSMRPSTTTEHLETPERCYTDKGSRKSKIRSSTRLRGKKISYIQLESLELPEDSLPAPEARKKKWRAGAPPASKYAYPAMSPKAFSRSILDGLKHIVPSGAEIISVGKRVAKDVGDRLIWGHVVDLHREEGTQLSLYKIKFENGSAETLHFSQVAPLVAKAKGRRRRIANPRKVIDHKRVKRKIELDAADMNSSVQTNAQRRKTAKTNAEKEATVPKHEKARKQNDAENTLIANSKPERAVFHGGGGGNHLYGISYVKPNSARMQQQGRNGGKSCLPKCIASRRLLQI